MFFRRQNEDLRAKLDAGGVNPNTSLAVESNKNEAEMRKIAEKECESLRTTVAKLDRLLNIEREERALNEKKTLDVSPPCILRSYSRVPNRSHGGKKLHGWKIAAALGKR